MLAVSGPIRSRRYIVTCTRIRAKQLIMDTHHWFMFVFTNICVTTCIYMYAYRNRDRPALLLWCIWLWNIVLWYIFHSLIPYYAEIFLYKPWIQKGFIKFAIILVLSGSFEYLCYGSTAIINISILTVQGSTLDVRIWRLDFRFWRLIFTPGLYGLKLEFLTHLSASSDEKTFIFMKNHPYWIIPVHIKCIHHKNKIAVTY